MPTIADALGIDYHGAGANISAGGRAGFSSKATYEASRLHEPSIKPGGPDITEMISRRNRGLGDNVDVFA